MINLNLFILVINVFLGCSQLIFLYCQLEKFQDLSNKVEKLGQGLADLSSKMDAYTSKLASTKEQICQITPDNSLIGQKSSWIDAATANNYLLPIVAVALTFFILIIVLPYAVPLITPYFFKKSLENKSKEIVESAAGTVSRVSSPNLEIGEEIISPELFMPLASSSVSEASASTSVLIPIRYTYAMGEEAIVTATADSFVDLSLIHTNTEEIRNNILSAAAWQLDNASVVSQSLPSIDSSVPTTDEISSDLLNAITPVLDEVTYDAIRRSLFESLVEESVMVIETILIAPLCQMGPVVPIQDSIANVGMREEEDGQVLCDFLDLIWDHV